MYNIDITPLQKRQYTSFCFRVTTDRFAKYFEGFSAKICIKHSSLVKIFKLLSYSFNILLKNKNEFNQNHSSCFVSRLYRALTEKNLRKVTYLLDNVVDSGSLLWEYDVIRTLPR